MQKVQRGDRTSKGLVHVLYSTKELLDHCREGGDSIRLASGRGEWSPDGAQHAAVVKSVDGAAMHVVRFLLVGAQEEAVCC